MRRAWYARFYWPVLLFGCIVVASYWPHIGSTSAGIPQRMVWVAFLTMITGIPILSVLSPVGRSAYVALVSLVVLAVALGLAIHLNGGIPAIQNKIHYQWVAAWLLLVPMIAWVSISALTRYFTERYSFATRLITVGGLYLLAIMTLETVWEPLRELYFLTFSYATLLFTYLQGNGSGIFFPQQAYHLTIDISLGVSIIAWCVLGITAWVERRERRSVRVAP